MKRIILAGFVLVTTLTFGIQAQRLDQDCNPIAFPRECQRFADSVASLERRIANMQARMNRAGGALKADLIRTIARLNSQLDAAKADLKRCVIDSGETPRELAPAELTSNFTGTATLRTTDRGDAAGPFDVDFDVDIRFTRNRCFVTITRFPTITLKIKDLDVVGSRTVTVTQTQSFLGTFHPVSGTMGIFITLHFHYGTVLVNDDDATFYLTTDHSLSGDGTFDVTGSPLNADNRIRLVATTRFRNGYLDRKYGSLVIRANVTPRP